jgi:hypothetical protein
MLRIAKFFVKEDQFVEMNKSMYFQILIDSLLLSFADNSISFDDLFETSTFSSFDDLFELLTFSFETHNLKSFHNVLEFSLTIMKNSSIELFEMSETLEKTIKTRKDFTTKRLKRCICSTNVLDAWKKNVRKKKLTIKKCLIFLKQTYTFNKFCYYHMRWLINK